MAEPQSALAQRPASLKDLLQQEGYKARFNSMLGSRAPQFMSSILNLASATSFRNVEPKSILAAAAVAATLDLPIDKNLGFAWVIPYGRLAQFQIGWKGVVQLALRSGQYSGMNAFKVNAEALGGYDEIGDPIILWEKLDKTKEAAGYAFAWRLVNGFHKIVYWTKEEVDAHAKRYSQAYKGGRKDSPWFDNFDKMALKTVVKNALTAWGVLSVEMRQAAQLDQSAAIDIEATPIYPDNDDAAGEEDNGSATNRAETLTEKLKTEREAVQAQATEPAPAAASAPASSDPRSRLLDTWNNCVESQTLKIAKDALESATGHHKPDKVPDGLIEKAINALNESARSDN